MPQCRPLVRWMLVSPLAVLLAVSCAPEYRPWWLGGTSARVSTGGIFASPLPTFNDVLIQSRVFVEGHVVTTATYDVDDLQRLPVQIDFNRDGRIDPVVAYRQSGSGVVQILLSFGDGTEPQYASLTLDGGENDWAGLNDVAVGDIDGDGALDLVLATADGVIYLHHPSDPNHTHVLSEWGQDSGDLEVINGTRETLTAEELEALIAAMLDPTINPDYYIVTYKAEYTNVEIGDFDNDGYNDIAASRRQQITLDPKPDYPLEKITFISGSVQLLLNPGFAVNGEYWTGFPVGLHERHSVLDRQGASDLRAYDIDGDGDLDLITAASDDQNVQLAWFENLGGPGVIDPTTPWPQYRIGSIRGPTAIDIGDISGDGRVDVIAASATQMQAVLFIQPEQSPGRGFDWYGVPIITFKAYEPRAVKALDVDNDGTLEIVIGGTNGAVRYFEPPAAATDPWEGIKVTTYDPPGDVGVLGYGDLDGDGDLDLVTVVAGGGDTDGASNADRVAWIRNELIP